MTTGELERAVDLISQLADDREVGDIARRTLAFVDGHPDALLRSCRDGHLTGSTLVLDHDHDRLAVLFHAKLRRWLQPGGHADGDGDLARVALREAVEETRLDGLDLLPDPVDIDIHRVDPPREPAHLHLDVRFVAVAPAGAVLVGNHESLELRWVRLDELRSLEVDESVLRLARRGRDCVSR